MDFNLLIPRKNITFFFIMLFLAQLKSFLLSTCKKEDDFNSQACFNDIIKLDNKNYRAGQISTNEKNDLIIEYSDSSPGNSRLFYALKENGRGFFLNESPIKEVTMSGAEIINRYESINAFISLESDTNKEKQYLLSISSDKSLTEIHDMEEGTYQQWLTTDFLNIEENRYIFSLRFSFLEWKNTNTYFLVFIQKAGTDSEGKDFSNSYTIKKFSFKKEKNKIQINHLAQIEDKTMHNVRVVSATIVDYYDLLVVAYVKEKTTKLTVKFYNSTLTAINDYIADTIIDAGSGAFLKIITCKDDYIAIMFFVSESDQLSIKLSFKKIGKNVLNRFYLENIMANYGFGEYLNTYISLNDFYKINENRFIFVSTFEYSTKLFIAIIEAFNSYNSLKWNKYTFNLASSTNNVKFTKELSLGMYKGFLLFTSTISSNTASAEDYSSYLIFFGYANGTDFEIDISSYFADIDGYDTNNNLVKFLLDQHASIDNNIFSYKLLRKIKLISVPKEIKIYNKNDQTQALTEGSIVDEDNFILFQNKEITKTNKLYDLKYQFMVQEPDSYLDDSKTYQNGQILFGRVNKLSMKLCHEFCETCIQLGISNNEQYCLSCSEPYNYNYFSYFNIYQSNCVPEGYYYDIETRQLIKCDTVEHKYYFNKTDNNKKICFKYDYDCPTSYNFLYPDTNECFNYIYSLYEDLSEVYTDYVISNLVSIINSYVFLDVAQNPKIFKTTHSTHPPIDLITSLNNVKKENRQYYEFYREIREILGSVKDMHLNIYFGISPNGILLEGISACIPFSFYIDKDSSDNKIKVYIKYEEKCGNYYNDDVKNYVRAKDENKIALKLINGKDPFEYIQNFGWNFLGTKSPHGYFSLVKSFIHTVYLHQYPFTPEELNIKYEFESDDDKEDFIILDYYVLYPNFQTIKKLYKNNNKNLLFNYNKNEFLEFFREELKKHSNNINIPNIFQMLEKFNEKNGIFKKELKNKNDIQWDYLIEDSVNKDGLKCRVDNDNQVNVFVQQTFNLDITTAPDIIRKCALLFYSNDYPIIGIENLNGGGIIILAQIFHQLLQIKIQDRMHFAGKSTNFYKKEIKVIFNDIINVETCKPFNDIDEFMDGIVDDYSTNSKQILHKRTKILDFSNKYLKESIHEIRKYIYENSKPKRPTDIIIFTDGFSFSATSLFIKGFQKTGGAITVGFNGNPKLSDDLFDASQSPTNVMLFNRSEEIQNLLKAGVVVVGISASESFSYDYKNKNAMPLEYDFDLVDERVDIYNAYSDEVYQNFIDKGKEIFKKYNQDKKCNKKNKQLLLDPNDEKTCYTFKDDTYAHGGFECGNNGYWNEVVCKKYYCDLGYYYDLYEKKCKIDPCTNSKNDINLNKNEEINLEGEYNNIIILNETNNKEYIFHVNNSKFIYFFKVEGNEGYIHYNLDNPCPNLCVIQYSNIMNYTTIHLNINKNATKENIIVYISSVKINSDFISSISLKFYNETINTIKPINFEKSYYILQTNNNYIVYFDTFSQNTKIRFTLYQQKITETDILNINEQYFFDCKDKLMHLERGEIYIITISSSNILELNKSIKILIQPFIISDNIEIIDDKTNLLFLPKSDEEYTLDFAKNHRNIILQLSRSTEKAEMELKDEITQKTTILNSRNLYYTFDEGNTIYKNKLKVKVKENALIEFLMNFSDGIEILKNKEYMDYKIKGNTIISFTNNAFDEPINITIYSKINKPFKYSIISGYSLGNYYHYSNDYNIELLKSEQISDTIEVKLTNNNLMEGENFYMMLTFEENNMDQIYLIKKEKFNLDIFNVDLPDEKSQLALNNIIKLVEEGYAYNDIIKNPPNIEYFGKIDLISELKKVETKKRRYLDFYRDIRKITSQTKDLHLNILPLISPNNYTLDNLEICLPFSFYIKGDSKESTYMYIEINEDCFSYFTSEQQSFIFSHLDKHLLSINNTEPFEFIQNLQSEFNQMHNKQAQFSITLETAHKLSFMHNPFTREQISNIEFVFDGGDSIFLDYYLKYKEKNNVKENKDLKDWKYSTKIINGFKCLIDDEKKVNVFKLGSITLNNEENYLNVLDVILNCTKEFYKNSYPIIGLENDDNGGDIKVGLYLQELLQVKLAHRTYFSMKNSNLAKNYVNKNINNNLDIINTETCEAYKNLSEMGEIIDNYGSNNVLNRTKVFQLFNRKIINKINKIRKELFKLKNLKRPTDIIIFTDGFSLGTSSFLIKGLQKRGGAIIVGYNGNPKSDEVFDSTQSTSSYNSFKNSVIYNNLLECGFIIKDTSFYLSYDDSFQKKNPIPNEFEIFPVDERVNIFHKYNDSYYDEFINKALIIFDKYNNKKECNKNNLLLTYDPNDGKTCYKFDNDEHAHGGYQCSDNGTWSDICIPYYCDIGYIFDTYYNKCVKDKCIDDNNTIQGKENIPETKEEEENNELPVYAIILISIGSVLVLLIIITIIIIKCFSKNLLKSDTVETLMPNLN